MLKLSFKQTKEELMVRIASTLIFNQLVKANAKIVSIREITEGVQYGYTEKSSESENGPKYVRITDLKDGRVNWDTVPYCKCDNPEQYLLKQGDLIFARTGATTGKTHLFRETPPVSVFASYLIRVRPTKEINPEYLYFFFQSDLYWSQISSQKEGSAQPNVNGQKLSNIELPIVDEDIQRAICKFLAVVRVRQDGFAQELPELPHPLEGQCRIVEHVEIIATRIAKAQSLREEASQEVDYLYGREVAELFTNAKDWQTYNLGELTTDVSYGTSEKAHSERIGTPVFRMGNIQSGKLDLSDMKYMHPSQQELKKLTLQKGDILVNRTNSAELVGKCAVFDLDGDYLFASYIIRLRIDPQKANPYLVAEYINSPLGRAYMFAERKQMTGQANVNSQKLRALPIKLPPLDEQRRIVAYLDSVQARLASLRELQSQTQEELESLLPSVLDRAFKGEL